MDRQTLDTYNNSAPQLAEYFRGIGSRIEDIEKAIELRGVKDNLRVLELGCGDGRDGAEIAKRAEFYTGIDYSEGMIQQARLTNPEVSFEVADMQSYVFPRNLDIIFAFASLLHLEKEAVEQVFRKAYFSLSENGIFYVSTKLADSYRSDVKEDSYGARLFYYYSLDELVALAKPFFRSVYYTVSVKGSTEWIEIGFKKRNGKLIRDLLPDIIRNNGEEPEIVILTDEEYPNTIDDKFVEEAIEIRSAVTDEEKLEELSDSDELTDARLKTLGKTREDLERVKREKAKKRGGFARKYYLISE